MATLLLTVTLEVPNDPEPGAPARFAKVFPWIGKMLTQGATAGETEQSYEYTVGGSPECDIATVHYRVERVS